ncbi:hypothetical protein BMUNKI379_11970 [Burkholderia multivorans]|uniref:hypothetical protein n=1 Tax=Burkholderia multivorans TaxID=87883 RepID=UPI0006C79740|nr:hypothetical protein [Burkholderia multivorans]KPJ34633.1 hypothetical protein BMUNKI379_11970 [Burkholderia multivorans]
MPTRNHAINPRRLLACPASLIGRGSVASARGPSRHAGAASGPPVASRRLEAAQCRGERRRHRSPQQTTPCASAGPNNTSVEPRSNSVAARAHPTLLVTGSLTASDEAAEGAGLHVCERVESLARALRQPCLAVDALIAEVTSLHIDLANQFVSLARARHVRAAALVYEHGSAQALSAVRRAGFHLFRSVGGRVDQTFVLTKLQQSVAVTLAATMAANDPVWRLYRDVEGWARAPSACPSCAYRAGAPATRPHRHACPRARR